MSNHGAVDRETNNYVLPNNASKGREYTCADCNQRVILRQGSVRVHHFAHFNPSTKCRFYNTSVGESEYHKHAKLLLQKWLRENRKITFGWACQNQHQYGKCSTMNSSTEHTIKYRIGDEVLVEYRDPRGKYVADVAVLNNGIVRYIIEIRHSHQTTTSHRPEPWFEVNSSDVDEGCHYGSDEIFLENCRINEMRLCANCRVKKEKWVSSLPILDKRYGQERMWEQDVPCICCGRKKYNPEWIEKKPRQVCKICLGNEPQKVKEMANKLIWGE